MPRTVLITGATGLVGGYLVNALIERGDEVIALTTNPESARKKLPQACKIVSLGSISELVSEKIDVIINLAGKNIGENRWSDKIKKEIYDSRIQTTRKLVELIKTMQVKPEALINTSGSDYYGNRGNELITEESAPGSDFLSEVCIDWEKEAYNAEDYGVRVVIIRNGFVMAKNAPAINKLTLPFRFFAGGTIGSGKQYMSWIHIDDLVRIYLLAIDNMQISGAVNGTAPNPVTMKEFCKNIGAVMHRPSIFPVPSLIVKIIAGKMSEVVLNGKKAIPEKLLQSGFKFGFKKSIEAWKNVLS